MPVPGVVLAAIFGAVVGSFLNVIIYRVPLGLSIVRPRSMCPHCKATLSPLDNVPIFSWVVLRGRCRKCQSRITLRYPVVEVANTVLWALAAIRFAEVELAVFVGLTGSVLLTLSVIDLDVRRLPNVIVLPSIVAGVIWVGGASVARGELNDLWVALAAGGAAFAIFFVIALITGGMGFGDVKLAGFVGLVTGRFGAEVAAVAIFGSFFIGGMVAAVLLALRRRGRKDAIPFGPSLALGGLVALFFGPSLAAVWLGTG